MFSKLDFTNLEKIYESHKSLVYRALRVEDNRPIILKVLKEEYPTPEDISRYEQEYEILRHLPREGVIQAYELLRYRNSIALVLEDFGGDSLDIILKKRTLSVTEFLEIGIKIAGILGRIHQAGIIHKDINPSNIVLNEKSGELKLIDFGISQTISSQPDRYVNSDIVRGTLAYISPEQTGRTSHQIDRRTDLYSLGVTFYQLLTSRLPFETEEAIEMLHSHVARQPVPISQINPEIPEMVSAIAMKLLSKNPESRYQNAYGIQADLQKCLVKIRQGDISSFDLGEQDLPDVLKIPQKLYARDTELKQLTATFENVRQGSCKLTVISGYSGVGKSALVSQLREIVVKKDGCFISGKFDRLHRIIPYNAIVAAFKELIQQLLTKSSEKLEQWRDSLSQSLGINGQILINLIPEIELIIGTQPPLIEVSSEEAQNRFQLLFHKFIKVFSHPDTPLIIFLDDLHWADFASLNLIKSIVEDPGSSYLWFIGAYRDNAIASSHPLSALLSNLKDIKSVNYIQLQPLNVTEVNQLIADTFKTNLQRTKSLAELVYKKTQGNPFFMSEFLKSLYEEKLISLQPRKLGNVDDNIKLEWQWNLAQIERKSVSDNVVDLMILRIQKLPPKTQNILKLAACLGNQFDVKNLAIVSQRDTLEVIENLRDAIDNELIILRPKSQPISEGKLSSGHYIKIEQSSLTFVHERIQQAAYSLIPEERRKSTHLQIGRLLLQQIKTSEREEKIFDALDRLNTGMELITDISEREELAKLNSIAAEKAKKSAAYESAFFYLKIALDLLDKNCWKTQYELALNLYVEAVEAAYITGALPEMRTLAAVVLKQSRTVLDTIKVYEILIKSDTAQNRPLAALKIALSVLELLDVRFPETPTEEDVISEFQRFEQALQNRKVAELMDLPIMTAPDKLAAMQILSNTIAAAYFISPAMMTLIILASVNLSFKYGNTSWSCPAYAHYGLLIAGSKYEIDLAYEFGHLALNLVAKLNASEVKAKTVYAVYSSIIPYKQHVKETLEPLIQNYQLALETGDIKYAAHSISIYSFHATFIGSELAKLERELDTYCRIVYQLKQDIHLDFLNFGRQITLNLMGKCESPWRLVGEAYDEEERRIAYQESNNISSAYILDLQKSILCYLFEKLDLAWESMERANDFQSSSSSTMLGIQFYFYNSLIKLAIWHKEPEIRAKIWDEVALNQQNLKLAADDAPVNFLHKFYLVEAERYRVLELDLEAMKHYDLAIKLARENEYVNEEALAYELATKYYLDRDKEIIAQAYLQEAYYCYMKWGAKAKAQHLKEKYGQQMANVAIARPAKTSLMQTTDNHSRAALDLETVLKASQAISSEIVLENLVEKLMKIMMQNAGARVGCLINVEGDRLSVAAIDAVSDDRDRLWDEISFQAQSPVSATSLPTTILNYVKRTQESVVLDNASSEGQFTRDPYILDRQPKSILCTPLIHQGKVTSIIYLENNLTLGAFTAERLTIINLLRSQAAISLENAKLYARQTQYANILEDKVTERTSELAKVNDELSRLAALDGLTQVANRRHFDEFFAQQWKRLQRDRQTLSLILADVDFFKLYNDCYGHQSGDRCLQQVAQAMKRAAQRPADLVARYGGEEFGIILPNTEPEGAITVARAIQKEVQKLRIPHAQSQVSEYVTLSLGISCQIPAADSALEDAIAMADMALYQAKRQGRDRWTIEIASDN